MFDLVDAHPLIKDSKIKQISFFLVLIINTYYAVKNVYLVVLDSNLAGYLVNVAYLFESKYHYSSVFHLVDAHLELKKSKIKQI